VNQRSFTQIVQDCHSAISRSNRASFARAPTWCSAASPVWWSIAATASSGGAGR
jgi:hypothetical protein